MRRSDAATPAPDSKDHRDPARFYRGISGIRVFRAVSSRRLQGPKEHAGPREAAGTPQPPPSNLLRPEGPGDKGGRPRGRAGSRAARSGAGPPPTTPVAGLGETQQRRHPGKRRWLRCRTELCEAGPGPGPVRRRFPGPPGGRVFLPVQPHPSPGCCSRRQFFIRKK